MICDTLRLMLSVPTSHVRRIVVPSFYVVREPFGGDRKATESDSLVCVEVCYNNTLCIVDCSLFIEILSP